MQATPLRKPDATGQPAPWLTLGIASLVAFSLRTVLVGVGPVVPAIRADLGISFEQAGILLSTPIALIALLGFPSGWSADRWGAPRVLAAGVLLLAAGAISRGFAADFTLLWGATLAMGIGLGTAQTALPRLVRDIYPQNVGTATGVYSFGIHSGATIGAYTSGSILLALLGSWRGTFWLWGAIAAVSGLLWLAFAARLERPRGAAAAAGAAVAARLDAGMAATRAPAAVTFNPWRSSAAWLIALIFGIQAVIYFALTSWLPSYFFELQWELGPAGVAAAGVVFGQVPAVLVSTYFSDRFRRRKPFLIAAAACMLIGIGGVLLFPVGIWAYAFPLVAGVGHGTIFAISLTIPADIAPRSRVGATAGFVITVSYFMAALGPYLLGIIRQWSGSMVAGITFVLGLTAVLLLLTLLMWETYGKQPDRSSG